MEPACDVGLADWATDPFSSFPASSSPCMVDAQETGTDESPQQELKGHTEHLSWSG